MEFSVSFSFVLASACVRAWGRKRRIQARRPISISMVLPRTDSPLLIAAAAAAAATVALPLTLASVRIQRSNATTAFSVKKKSGLHSHSSEDFFVFSWKILFAYTTSFSSHRCYPSVGKCECKQAHAWVSFLHMRLAISSTTSYSRHKWKKENLYRLRRERHYPGMSLVQRKSQESCIFKLFAVDDVSGYFARSTKISKYQSYVSVWNVQKSET